MFRSYQILIDIALKEFSEITARTEYIGGTPASPNKIRFYIVDESFLDVWLSPDGDYAYHWEHRRQTGKLYRWDNAPHHRKIRTFPHHFHQGEEKTVTESYIDSDPGQALREVLSFITQQLSSK